MSTVLFATWDGGGNVSPMVALAGQMRQSGHTIRVMGHRQQAGAVAAVGLPFTAYATAADFSSRQPNPPPVMAAMSGDRGMGADVLAVAVEADADLVVVDCLLFGVMGALFDAGRRYVVLEHMFDGFLRNGLLNGPVGQELMQRGHHPRALLDAAEVCLAATLPALDPPTGTPNLLQVGPFNAGSPSRCSEPTVLVSLSTYAYPSSHEVWQRILDAVADLPFRVIATTGPVVDPAALRAAENTEVRTWADHAELMPEVSMLVGHGGHSTTMQALAHGLPLVIIPLFPFVDQPLVARAIDDAGAGLSVPTGAPPDEIAAAIQRVMTEPAFRAEAARMADQIKELDGLRHASSVIAHYSQSS